MISKFNYNNILALFIGGGAGTVLRYCISLAQYNSNFPYSTLIVNIVSSLIFGFVYAFAVQKIGISAMFQLFLLTGFCGGLSTMSAFSFESWTLYERGLYIHLAVNLILNYTLPILAVFTGVYIGRQI